MKIGIFGGTFNPIHNAHLRIASYFSDELNLDKCYFLPANISPFKIDEVEANDTFHRIEMLKIALEKHENFSLDLFEINKGGVSYTFETILYFKNKFPKAELFLLLGADQAIYFHKWKNYELITQNATLCIAHRENIDLSKLNLGRKYIVLQTPMMNISSSYIRENIKNESLINDLIPQEVLTYIQMNNVYD